MKHVVSGIVLLLFCAGFISADQNSVSVYTRESISTFKADARAFALSVSELKSKVERLNAGDSQSRMDAIEALRASRLRYKRIEAFMEYFFSYPVNLYNRAPVYEVEEPYMEYQAPVGLQYIESLLLEPDAYSNKKEILDQCDVIGTSASDIPATLYDLKIDDDALLEAQRLELIRVITLSISGYDAPMLKSGIAESAVTLRAMKDNLSPLLTAHPGLHADSIIHYLNLAVQQLEQQPQFDGFDRLVFLTRSMLPLQSNLASYIKELQLDVNTHTAINHNARHLFNPDAINLDAFVTETTDKGLQGQLETLGKALFSEKALSGNRSRSCASCHKPEMAFTDGLVKSKTLDGKSVVKRNAPSLFYAAYQRSQFYDGRAASLEEQIKVVLQSPLEMDANADTVVHRLNSMPRYRALFRKIWPADTVSMAKIASALVAYERTLAPFRSPFDRYISGDTAAMNIAQKRGFNLFMGKAQCGTCHFAPLFNGLLPPYYEVSELEIIGVPQRDARGRQKADSDSGRYSFFPISFNNGAFKTSSVRNAARTAPYMHNGVFKTLDEVIDFYDKGGGKGLKLQVPNQTLSDKPLKLTTGEKKDIIAFLQALTDDTQ